MIDESDIRRRFRILSAFLDERLRRLVAAAESEAVGYGGISMASRATGVSRRAIAEGAKELRQSPPVRLKQAQRPRVRRKGGGRKRTVDKDPTLAVDLERLVEPATRGNPASPLRWRCQSVRKLAAELKRRGHPVSPQMVADLLHAMDYSLQANRKTLEGAQHPDRDAQFEYLNKKVRQYLARRQPVISVDTKKKELVGNFKNGGRELRRTTRAGLRVKSQLDTNPYPAGIRVSDKQMMEINLQRDDFHGEWNYSIIPRGNQVETLNI